MMLDLPSFLWFSSSNSNLSAFASSKLLTVQYRSMSSVTISRFHFFCTPRVCNHSSLFSDVSILFLGLKAGIKRLSMNKILSLKQISRGPDMIALDVIANLAKS